MIETAMYLGLVGIVLGTNATIIGFLIKIYYKLGTHSRDIKYIKQAIGMTGCKGRGNNGMENDRPRGED